MRISTIFASCLLLVTTPALARTVEPGSFSLSAGIGPTIRLGSTLSAGRAYFVLQGQAEYDFTSELGAVADLSYGIGSSQPLRFHIGGRYRFTKLDLPVSPYAQLQFTAGRLYNVLGANLPYYGARVGGGADYFLTRNFGAGAMVGADLGSTTGDRPTFYGAIDILVYATYTF